MKAKLNCWEYQNCKVGMNSSIPFDEQCSAAKATSCNNINNGSNGGRICWSVSGTLCSSNKKGCNNLTLNSCMECEFYKLVLEEEGASFLLLRPVNRS